MPRIPRRWPTISACATARCCTCATPPGDTRAKYTQGVGTDWTHGPRQPRILSGPQLEGIRILGKGRRDRELPLWKETKAVLNEWLDVRPPVNNRYLFLNARGRAMSPDGFAYILSQHVATAMLAVPSLKTKRVSRDSRGSDFRAE